MNTRVEGDWVIDENNNCASIAYYGSEANAIESLKTLKDCSHCSGCSGCSGCLHCFHCSGCSGCFHCSGCPGCFYCSRCSDCSDCSRCYRCSGCFRCSDCSRCSHCSGCSRCSGCSPQLNKALKTIPVIEDIHKKIYEAVLAPDALCMSTWHKCDTTHCRAGWVVTLAGEPGRKLESLTSTLFAAQQIYRASGYDISPVRFFDSDESAMADMKRLAEAN